MTTSTEVSDPLGLIGTTIADKFELLEGRGEGGFSVVYRAMHTIWQQPVAIKCFVGLAHAPEASRQSLLNAFIKEGDLMARLSSRIPEIVQARDVGTHTTADGRWFPYMVLEWLEGISLEDILDSEQQSGRGPRSVREVMELLRGPCTALALVHREGVAHRDIKPANLFVCGGVLEIGSTIKLLDFGVAKVMQSHETAVSALTGTHVTSFTPNYGAPEQFDRTHGATGPWTDVFGMALVMVELLAGGRPALQGEDFMQFAYASQNRERRPTPRSLDLRVSDSVEAVFERALAVNIGDRYSDMGTFWDDLCNAVEQDALGPIPRMLSMASRASSSAITPILPPDSITTGPVPSLVPPSDSSAVRRPAMTTSPAEAAPRRRLGAHIWFGGAAAAMLVAAGFIAFNGSSDSGDTTEATAAAEAEAKAKAAPPPPKPCPDRMAFIRGGKFFMGADGDHPALATAKPPHQVELGPYCLDEFEVTVDEFRQCSNIGECKRAYLETWWPQGNSDEQDWIEARKAHDVLCNERYDDRGRHPINCVTWEQAKTYCAWAGKRLPEEAEWEFASRTADGRLYPWGDDPPTAQRGNSCGAECRRWMEEAGRPVYGVMYEEDDGYSGTAPVGSFPEGKTERGLYDMVGNVFEWVEDRYLPYPDPDRTEEPEPTEDRVIRGGAFNSFMPQFSEPALRYGQPPDTKSHGVGFRCAKAPDPAALKTMGADADPGEPATGAAAKQSP